MFSRHFTKYLITLKYFFSFLNTRCNVFLSTPLAAHFSYLVIIGKNRERIMGNALVTIIIFDYCCASSLSLLVTFSVMFRCCFLSTACRNENNNDTTTTRVELKHVLQPAKHIAQSTIIIHK